MNKIVYFLLVLAVIACGNKTTGKVNAADSAKENDNTVAEADDDYVPQRSDYSFRSEVRTIKDDDEVRWDSIIVYLTDAKGHTLQLYSQAQPLDTMMWVKRCIGQISEDDWNFDGIPDLQVSMGPMNGFGNITYDVWLWDDKEHQFVYLKQDGEIFDPYIDTENKTIVSTWRLDDEVEIIRYKWKDGKLVQYEREKLSTSELTDD